MPRQFGDGQHRQETQHPPGTHGVLARRLFSAFARTVPEEELLTNASAALPSMDMPARAGCYRRSFDEDLWLRRVYGGREIGHGNVDPNDRPERVGDSRDLGSARPSPSAQEHGSMSARSLSWRTIALRRQGPQADHSNRSTSRPRVRSGSRSAFDRVYGTRKSPVGQS